MGNKYPPRLRFGRLNPQIELLSGDFDIHGNRIQYISELEHEAILAGVNNQLQACDRQIDQFQSKLCKQDEAIKVAMEALEEISKHERLDFLDDKYYPTEEAESAKEAKQKIEEILTKENEDDKQ